MNNNHLKAVIFSMFMNCSENIPIYFFMLEFFKWGRYYMPFYSDSGLVLVAILIIFRHLKFDLICYQYTVIFTEFYIKLFIQSMGIKCSHFNFHGDIIHQLILLSFCCCVTCPFLLLKQGMTFSYYLTQRLNSQ